MTKEQAFEKLKEYSTQLDRISYEEIYNLLKYTIKEYLFHKQNFIMIQKLIEQD